MRKVSPNLFRGGLFGSAWDIKWQIIASTLPETVKFNSCLVQRGGTPKETLSLLPNHATPSGTEKDFAKHVVGPVLQCLTPMPVP